MKMKTIKFCVAAIPALCMLFCLCFAAGAVEQRTTDFLSKFPAQNAQERDAVCGEIVKLGPDYILTEVLNASSTPVFDAKVQFLLNGVADYVSRPGAVEERKAYAEALSKAIVAPEDCLKNPDIDARKENLAFLITLIQNIGDASNVDALVTYLADDRLCAPAARTLVTIGSENAAEALAKALNSSTGARRITIMQSLGEMRCKICLEAITKDALSGDALLRKTAMAALSSIGDLTSLPILANLSTTGSGHEKAEATSYYVQYAANLGKGGHPKEAEAAFREILSTRKDPGDSYARCAALTSLADLKGKDAFVDIVSAIDSDDKEFRGCALRLTLDKHGKHCLDLWLEKLPKVDPERRAEILPMLAMFGDEDALPAISAALKDEDKGVRIAALSAATRLGGERSCGEILARLGEASDADESKAVKEALLRVVGKGQFKAVAEALKDASPASKKILLEILSARRATPEVEAVFAQIGDSEESVRVAAFAAMENVGSRDDAARIVDALLNFKSDAEKSAGQKAVVAICNMIENGEARADAILERYASASVEQKLALLPTFSGVWGEKALETVVAETQSSEASLSDAAVRALADWPTSDAIPSLFKTVKASQNESNQILALRGAVRLLGTSDISPADKVSNLKEAMSLAKRPEERTLILGTFADVRDIESLRAAAAYLDDEATKGDASVAIAKLVCSSDGVLKGDEVIAAMKKAIPFIADAEMKKQAEEFVALNDVSNEDGFVSLFNGSDLSGWTGDTAGYLVENNAIVCKPGGNLFTEAEYADFIFRFDFKLTANANNGVGIRAPLEGDVAYVGMEIQVLDDSGSDYTQLQPYQYHGSVYGVVPCERGHQKPVGEWNTEEIIAKGKHVIVRLNGATIVDADIEKASADGTLDHKEHPGLKNASGHIGFLGHGSVVEFKNLRVKELK